MSYIDREKAEKAIRAYADIKHNNGENIIYINGILKAIRVLDELPNADVVEVVRCKDCRFNKTTDYEGKNACIKQSAYKNPDDFCSYGERIT